MIKISPEPEIKQKKIPELCVPAGSLKILKYAVAYGADAIYVGGGRFNLRTMGDNFNDNELAEALDFAHSKKKKIYLALNAIIDENEMGELEKYIHNIKKLDFDAIIISDPGVFQTIRKLIPGARIHMSTQISTSNHQSVNFWGSLGASRVNLARELSHMDIKDICSFSNIEIEVFVHGALCISYSGRCMLSKYLTGRDANKGACSHTCRWKYYLMEEKRPNAYFPVYQDKRGTYIYNSRDLCLLPMLEKIVDTGVSSLKIEGRMKTENYVSRVTWVYRQALDLIKNGKFTEQKKSYLLKELDKTTHRTYTTGFMFLDGKSNTELTDNDNVGYLRKYRFAGNVESFSEKYDSPVIKARNQIKKGDMLDIIQPGKNPLKFKLSEIIDANSEKIIEIANTNARLILKGLGKIDSYSLINVKI
jgi:U32 family peptidase